MKKEQWKVGILNSLEGIKKAEPDALLYDKIKSKIWAGPIQVVRRPYVFLAAACLAVLVVSNVWMLSQGGMEKPAISVYQVDNANFDLY